MLAGIAPGRQFLHLKPKTVYAVRHKYYNAEKASYKLTVDTFDLINGNRACFCNMV